MSNDLGGRRALGVVLFVGGVVITSEIIDDGNQFGCNVDIADVFAILNFDVPADSDEGLGLEVINLGGKVFSPICMIGVRCESWGYPVKHGRVQEGNGQVRRVRKEGTLAGLIQTWAVPDVVDDGGVLGAAVFASIRFVTEMVGNVGVPR